MHTENLTSPEKYELSIIIPTYHRADDLGKLFDSLLEQTLSPKEIVIIDDTADDSIHAKCNDYEYKFRKNGVNLIYRRNPGQRSSARSRNYGIQFTTSDLVTFLDSDTVLKNNYFEEIVKKFRYLKNALGIQGWVIGPYPSMDEGVKKYISHYYNRLFLTGSYSSNRCRLFEYPIVLDETINCEWLSGSNMTLKRSVLDDYKFDDKLYKYSYSEDVLLSHSIFKNHPNSLYITPDAKLLHFVSDSGRMARDKSFYEMVDSQRKYCLYKLFGVKGLLIYYRQKIGLVLHRYLLGKIVY